jgi:hypothetical protein
MTAIIAVKEKNIKRNTEKTRNEKVTQMINHLFSTKKKQKRNTFQTLKFNQKTKIIQRKNIKSIKSTKSDMSLTTKIKKMRKNTKNIAKDTSQLMTQFLKAKRDADHPQFLRYHSQVHAQV